MPKNLEQVQKIFIVMLENRSFDHILGYLSLEQFGHPNWNKIEGIAQAKQYYQDYPYPPRPLISPSLDPDPPHEREDIDEQINSPAGKMRGFVDSYKRVFDPNKPGARLAGVMEYCVARNIPTTDFLARKFALCDHWFSCLPASTLPNRLMAMSGYALVDHTPGGVFGALKNVLEGLKRDLFKAAGSNLIYDWLDEHNVGWCVYHQGTPFFIQDPRVFERWESDQGYHYHFRDFGDLPQDGRDASFPQVVFIEPRYQDDPRREGLAATDDHPPASLWGGQGFLKIVYEAITTNEKDVWANSVAIITYDEHGGFFDHVPPLNVPAPAPPDAQYRDGFLTSGVRVPAIVVSPFVQPGSVYNKDLDHTSILKFIAEKFADGQYSPEVDSRRVESVSEVLDNELLAGQTPAPSPPPKLPDS